MNRTIPIVAVAASPRVAEAHPQPRSRVKAEYLRCAVPAAYGGLGGTAEDLAPLMRQLCAESLSAALLFWCQRMAIEFLVHSRNGALREYLLPDCLTYERAATVPFSLASSPLRADNTGRGWRLNGGFSLVGNAQADGFSLICPLKPEGEPGGWVVLRSEEDGVHLEPNRLLGPDHDKAQTAHLQVQNVFFREDEWLGDMALSEAVNPVCTALGVIYESLLNKMAPI